jgi:hypothetical protein
MEQGCEGLPAHGQHMESYAFVTMYKLHYKECMHLTASNSQPLYVQNSFLSPVELS